MGSRLCIIMIPTVARATEEVLRLVPGSLREASVALGGTESRTILRVVVPAARSGIILASCSHWRVSRARPRRCS